LSQDDRCGVLSQTRGRAPVGHLREFEQGNQRQLAWHRARVAGTADPEPRLAGRDVRSAQEFLDRARALVPSCLVLDISLPGLNGLELQKRVAAERRDMPVIFITGYSDVPKTVQAMKVGAVEFLTKPFNDDVLLRAIRQALERSRLALTHKTEMQQLRDRYESLTPRGPTTTLRDEFSPGQGV
jgi:CheY-like chemotaxis protein